jgi:hypothetical protein
MEDAMRKKSHKQQQKSSPDALLKTKTRDIELTEKELGQVTGGDKKIIAETIGKGGKGGYLIDGSSIPITTKT